MKRPLYQQFRTNRSAPTQYDGRVLSSNPNILSHVLDNGNRANRRVAKARLKQILKSGRNGN